MPNYLKNPDFHYSNVNKYGIKSVDVDVDLDDANNKNLVDLNPSKSNNLLFKSAFSIGFKWRSLLMAIVKLIVVSSFLFS